MGKLRYSCLSLSHCVCVRVSLSFGRASVCGALTPLAPLIVDGAAGSLAV